MHGLYKTYTIILFEGTTLVQMAEFSTAVPAEFKTKTRTKNGNLTSTNRLKNMAKNKKTDLKKRDKT